MAETTSQIVPSVIAATTSIVASSSMFSTTPESQNIGVGLFKNPSLMGTFSLPSPMTSAEITNIETFNMIYSTSSDLRKIPNHSKIDSLGDH